LSNKSSQTQTQSQAHAQQTPWQLAHANARSDKMAYEKATRIAQERTQEAAQEVERIKQEATADSRKAKKGERYKATMEKPGKLPPCPKLCRGGECDGIPWEEEEPGFPYLHIDDMVVCHDKLHTSVANRDRCFLFHLWPAGKRSSKPPPPGGPPAGPPAKNSGGKPQAQGTSPRATAATTRRLGSHGTQDMGTGPSGSSSSSNSLEGNSSSSSATLTTGGRSRS
jgi:hypothetical protein